MQDSEFELLTALHLCIAGSVTREGDLTSRFSDTRPRLPQIAVRSSSPPIDPPTIRRAAISANNRRPCADQEPRAESATWRFSGVSPVSGRRLLNSARGGFRAAMSAGIRSAIGYPVLSFDLGRLRRIRCLCAREPSEWPPFARRRGGSGCMRPPWSLWTPRRRSR
jgi:hypothetical protein